MLKMQFLHQVPLVKFYMLNQIDWTKFLK